MYCNNCKKDIPKGSDFCLYCGNQVTETNEKFLDSINQDRELKDRKIEVIDDTEVTIKNELKDEEYINVKSGMDIEAIDPKMKKLNYKKYIIIGSVIIGIICASLIIKVYLHNSKIENAFTAGIKVLNSDSEDNFEQTEAYFKNYIIDYPNSKHNADVKKLLTNISEYNNLTQKAIEDQNMKEFLEKLSTGINVLENYIDDAKEIHELARRGLYENDDAAIRLVLSKWEKNRDYYYGIYDDIDLLMKKDKSFNLFKKEEYNNFKLFFANAFIPAETTYNLAVYGDKDEVARQHLLDSWDKYSDLELQVTKYIANTRSTIKNLKDSAESNKNAIVDLEKEIKAFSSEQNDLSTTKL